APWDLVARVRELGNCGILNHYGPTETTVGSCTMRVEDGPGPYEPATVPIGRPISNTACYVLDQWGEHVPVGAPGRLLIGGNGVADVSVGPDELKRHLADWVPEFMLPSSIVSLDALPLTPSGKVDRLALPDPADVAGGAAPYAAPQTPLEEAVAVIWAEVLGLDRVGIEDD